MPKVNIGCDGLYEAFGRDFHSIIMETLGDGRERGSYIKLKDGKIKLGKVQKGKDTSIVLRSASDLVLMLSGEEIIGTFHTHPNIKYDEEMSYTDLKMLMDRDVEFIVIGYAEEGKTMFSVFDKPDNNNSYEEVVHNTPGDGELARLKRINRNLRVCKVELWPLN